MSNKDDERRLKAGATDRKPKARSRYADRPYEVGKGKPPVAGQFAPGNKRGGRRKGAKNRNHFEELLDEKVVVGYDSLGRPKRRTLRNVIDLQLLKKAGEGDLAAIRLVKEFEFKVLGLKAGAAPTERDLKEQLELEKQAERAKEALIKAFDLIAQLKSHGIIEAHNGQFAARAWVLDAMAEYRANHPELLATQQE